MHGTVQAEKTALMHAATHGHSCMTQILMDHGAALDGRDKYVSSSSSSSRAVVAVVV